MKSVDIKGLRTWIEIDKKAIKNNYNSFRKIISKKCKLCVVVKSNAYGHGFIDFGKEVSKLGADYLAVDSIMEALPLRKSGIKTPILILGHTLPSMVLEAVKNNLNITVSSFDFLNKIKNIKKQIKVHIKFDSGMHRQGFLPEETEKLIETLKEIKNIKVEGVYTHYAGAGENSLRELSDKQTETFKVFVKKMKDAGFNPIVHAGATSATIVMPESHFDMVRVGLGMYGLWPSDDTKEIGIKKINLDPILQWKTIITEIKEINEDSGIGYDFTEQVKKGTKIAICPVGYWHGIFRKLSRVGIVGVRGEMVKILGNVMMDMIALDVTKVKGIKVGDEVVIIGRSGKEYFSVRDFSKLAETSQYEVVTRINPLIKKFYI